MRRKATDRGAYLDEVRRREIGLSGRMDLRAILNESKLAIKANQTHRVDASPWAILETRHSAKRRSGTLGGD